MGILHSDSDHQVPRLDFELMAGCDHACGHCYNVWGAEDGDPQGGYKPSQLRPDAYMAMMEKAVVESGAKHITITGGEPLLRKGALDIVEKACELVDTVQIITNGSHLDKEAIGRLSAAGVRAVQLTLLSADPARHNLLKGADCFDETVRAAIDLREAGIPVQVCFVAMRQNWQDFEEVVELCHLLGVKQITYNRMSPTGGAVHHINRLMPEVEHVEHNLNTANTLARRYKIGVATAMPIPPCLIRIERYDWVRFGFCSTGTRSPNLTVDPMGNMRSCNLSSELLGNIVDEGWEKIHARIEKYQTTFKKSVPELCKGCTYERSCQGGCKESAFATFGEVTHPEPFRYLALRPEWLDELGGAQPAVECPGAAMGRTS